MKFTIDHTGILLYSEQLEFRPHVYVPHDTQNQILVW